MALPLQLASLGALSAIKLAGPSLNLTTPLYALLDNANMLPVLVPTNWEKAAGRYESEIIDYPVEQGSFTSVNKVRKPNYMDVVVTVAGVDLYRFVFLQMLWLREELDPTNLYTIITPHDVVTSMALESYGWESTQEAGSNLLRLSLVFKKVRQLPVTTPGQFAANPFSQGLQHVGQVFTQAVSGITAVAVTVCKNKLSSIKW